MIREDITLTEEQALQFVGRKVRKKSNRPFKSGAKIGTVTGVALNPYTGYNGFTFAEDDSIVDAHKCIEYVV